MSHRTVQMFLNSVGLYKNTNLPHNSQIVQLAILPLEIEPYSPIRNKKAKVREKEDADLQ